MKRALLAVVMVGLLLAHTVAALARTSTGSMHLRQFDVTR
jgi:hypothetical protein